MDIHIYINKQRIGSHSILGAVVNKLLTLDCDLGSTLNCSEVNNEVTIYYESLSYAPSYVHYADGTTAEELRDHDIAWLKSHGWIVKEINR